ncbi:MAG: hypothetical protein KC635_10395 [Myxococcales bacterium]|nr:hypothetical protein [Myxococcales bacterium]MCB9732769.1 hypothetical protein [Deltaproteobacteria bacterium]
MSSRSLVALLLLLAAPAQAAAPAPCDRPEIQAHLRVVEAELLAADVSALTPAQRASRARHIDALRAYREACVFPENTAFPGRLVPIFVDERGVHCAVGQLMADDGEDALVERIRRTHLTATIQELAGDPEVDAWLARAGLSWHEAARIQPEYCFVERSACLCNISGTGPDAAIADGRLESLGDASHPATLRVDALHGDSLVAVGDLIDVTPVIDDVVGRRALVVVTSGYDPLPRSHQTVSDAGVTCESGQFGATARVSLPLDVYIDALRSEDCRASVAAYDPTLGESVCADPGTNGEDTRATGEDAGTTGEDTRAGGDDASATVRPTTTVGSGCQGAGAEPLAALAFALLLALALARRRATSPPGS